MSLHKKDQFLEEIVSYVKFKFDREDIREEIENHILDRMEEYKEDGYQDDEAERLAIEAMGDAREIGQQLNKEHNPIIGWLWKITSYTTIIIGIRIALYIVFLIPSLLPLAPSNNIPRKEIVWKNKINEQVQIDDRVIKYKDLIYDKSGSLSIGYIYYDKKLWGKGWSLGHQWNIRDNFGYEYPSGRGFEGGGIISKGRWEIEDFNKEASSITIDYDMYNRNYSIKIPLEAGGSYD